MEKNTLTIQEQIDLLFEQLELLYMNNKKLKNSFEQAKNCLLQPAFDVDVSSKLRREITTNLVGLNASLRDKGLVRTKEEFAKTPEGKERIKWLEENNHE